MTFEEWWKACMGWTEYEPDPKEKALAQAAWEAAYQAGMDDVPIAEYEPPEGYTPVPVEPTEKMLKAARNAPMPLVHLDSFTACSNLILKTQYKAMIQAAQEEE